MRRWVCPDCKKGVLAPQRPRADDTRRVCLPCSEAKGRLVWRSCPALERQRTKKEEARADRGKRQRATVRRKKQTEEEKREAARERCWNIEGVSLAAEAADMWRVLQKIVPKVAGHPIPKITLTQSKTRMGVTGSHTEGRGVSVSIGSDRDLIDVIETLLHELVHAAVGCQQAGSRRIIHGHRFKSVLCEAADRLWKVDVWPVKGQYETDYELCRVMKAARAKGKIYPVKST